ncbi:hypothetical protein [Kordiimonas sp. SCSIO 12610]|uniref:hypothetical protein n=1 Tax=Kordiimonas sp. SCSIO 12610 TaxID=2829597 RepID=UPI00210D768F|nr:hypothetical protein [Kordiimonas sp. SCSIO 12610]UTW54390.1 hypothetical protein KFF44_11250 [Kordiimonas sp. SCSIO 12610]
MINLSALLLSLTVLGVDQVEGSKTDNSAEAYIFSELDDILEDQTFETALAKTTELFVRAHKEKYKLNKLENGDIAPPSIWRNSIWRTLHENLISFDMNKGLSDRLCGQVRNHYKIKWRTEPENLPPLEQKLYELKLHMCSLQGYRDAGDDINGFGESKEEDMYARWLVSNLNVELGSQLNTLPAPPATISETCPYNQDYTLGLGIKYINGISYYALSAHHKKQKTSKILYMGPMYLPYFKHAYIFHNQANIYVSVTSHYLTCDFEEHSRTHSEIHNIGDQFYFVEETSTWTAEQKALEPLPTELPIMGTNLTGCVLRPKITEDIDEAKDLYMKDVELFNSVKDD